MNKHKFSTLAYILFYVAAGISICCFLFLKGSSLSAPAYPVQTVSAGSETEIPETLPVSDENAEPSAARRNENSEPEETDGLETPASESPVFYTFTTLNSKTSLHVRDRASMNADIIGRLAPGVTGYVIERGPVWSLISASGTTGYVFNEYLSFQEVPEEEYRALSGQ